MQPVDFSTTLVVADPTQVARFYVEHFRLDEALNMGWFVSLRRGDAPWELCLWQEGHVSVPAGVRGPVAGVCLAFVVEDAAAEFTRMRAAGVEMVTDVRDEAWGQRHFYCRDPAGTLIDVVQFTVDDTATAF